MTISWLPALTTVQGLGQQVAVSGFAPPNETTLKTYLSAFPATENPIAESGNWINGGTTGLDWLNMQTTPGLVFGPANFLTSHYDDATAILSGYWRPNQSVQAVVKSLNQQNGTTDFEEVELRLRTSISANSITGYEVNWACLHNGQQYHQIGQWLGPIGVQGGCALGCAFQAVPNSTNSAGNGLTAAFNCFDTAAATAAWGTTTYGGLFDGDTVGASMVGNQIITWIIHNGIKVILESFLETSGAGGGAFFTSGSPGIGHWYHASAGAVSDFGFTSIVARELS